MMQDRYSSGGLTGTILQVICNRRLVRIGLIVAVALGVAAGVSFMGRDTFSSCVRKRLRQCRKLN